MRSPRRPAKTAEESALEKRQQIALDKEIEDTEEKLRLFSRRSLGAASLLSGAPRTTKQAAGAAKTMLSGGSRPNMSSTGSAGGSTYQSGQRSLMRK